MCTFVVVVAAADCGGAGLAAAVVDACTCDVAVAHATCDRPAVTQRVRSVVSSAVAPSCCVDASH